MRSIRLISLILLFLPSFVFAQDEAHQPLEEVKLKPQWDKDSGGLYGYVDERVDSLFRHVTTTQVLSKTDWRWYSLT